VRYQNVDLGDLGDLGDIFGSVFSGGGGFGSRGRQQARAHRGRDIQTEVPLTFEQAFSGTTVQVQTDAAEECPTCHGTGAKPGTGKKQCPTCGGSGAVSDAAGGMFGFSRTCPTCQGVGEVPETPCSTCRGQGRVRRSKPVSVHVPPGANDGGKLRFRGKGEVGENGGPSGDLYVVTRVKPHAFYRRDGADVLLDMPVSVSEAALGTEVRVPAPDGTRVKLKLPAGTQDGRVLRVAGKGAPKLKGKDHGDLLVKVKVVVPKDLTDEQRELYERLAEVQTGELRAHLK
jgi:molecular chaperone DnaJ